MRDSPQKAWVDSRRILLSAIMVAAFAFAAWLLLRPIESTGPSQPAPVAPARAIATEGRATVSFAGAHAYAGLPRTVGYPNPLLTLVNRAYTVGYDETRRNPAWSAYRLPADILPQKFPRPTRFRADTRTRAAVRSEDYTGSGFDRGHLTPNHAIATRFGAAAQEETFLMSNIIPQSPELNRGPWKDLEATVADRAAPACRELWVTVGPAYRGTPQRLRSDSEIPSACWMLIADETPSGPRLQAILLPQAPTSSDFRAGLTTVDTVERATGLDFYTDLPDEQEERLESQTPVYWLESP